MKEESDSIEGLVDSLAQILTAQSFFLGCAESCTGGLIAHSLTNRAGSSAWFAGGIVSYSNESKIKLLGVDEQILRLAGAVSRDCALSMAKGVRQVLAADVAMAVTGIAGPGGGSVSKPVGTVWIAWVIRDVSDAQHFLFQGDRLGIKKLTLHAALEGLYLRLTRSGRAE